MLTADWVQVLDTSNGMCMAIPSSILATPHMSEVVSLDVGTTRDLQVVPWLNAWQHATAVAWLCAGSDVPKCHPARSHRRACPAVGIVPVGVHTHMLPQYWRQDGQLCKTSKQRTPRLCQCTRKFLNQERAAHVSLPRERQEGIAPQAAARWPLKPLTCSTPADCKTTG